MAARRARAQAPLFLLGFHRGGTTYVQRILNCHRRVVVWGENGGLIAQLRKAHDRARNLRPSDVARYQEFDAFARFVPWASRVDQAGMRRAMAHLVRDLHRAAPPALFWGFKEIRHGNPRDLRFLHALFPEARMLLLARHPRDVLRSQLHVSWAPRRRHGDASTARRFAKRYLGVVTAFADFTAEHPEQVRLLSYEQLLRQAAIRKLFAWLGLNLGRADLARVRSVRAARVGSSFSDAAGEADAAAVDDVLHALAREMASSLDTLDARVRRLLLGWYPDLEEPG
jgi:hypothetical protein